MFESASDRILGVLILIAAIAFLATLSLGDKDREPVRRYGYGAFAAPAISALYVGAAIAGWVLASVFL